MRTAVVILPLTPFQIDDYFSSLGGEFAKARFALRKDVELQELAATPLMLSVITLAYHGKSVDDLVSNGTLETGREKVFATYVQQMLLPRDRNAQCNPKQTLRWLAWLARQMKKHNQAEFYLEQIQPDWLSDRRTQQLYNRVVEGALGRLFILLLCIGFFGIIYEFLFNLFTNSNIALLLGWGIALTKGLAISIFTEGLDPTDIKPVEVLSWTWKRLPKVFTISLSIGLSFVLITGLCSIVNNWLLNLAVKFTHFGYIVPQLGLSSWLIFSLFVGLLVGLIAGISSGFSIEKLDKRTLVKPNQPIWRSAQNSLLSGLSIGLTFALIFGFIFKSIGGLQVGLINGLLIGLFSGLIAGLFLGGIACIQHTILRFLLWRAGCTPLNYPRFLDYAVDRILLRKVGGGYIFVHRLLLEYFASLEPTSSPQQ